MNSAPLLYARVERQYLLAENRLQQAATHTTSSGSGKSYTISGQTEWSTATCLCSTGWHDCCGVTGLALQ